jgi:regulator of nucleoside diphosphate kinase
MEKSKHQLVVRKDDYDHLLSYLKGGLSRNSFDIRNAYELETELKKAKVVNIESFPQDVVRLNSKVKIKEESDGRLIELTLVTPEKADMNQKKISVMAPIGTALIGFSKGAKVKWRVPSGSKTFTIVEVLNEMH